MRYRTAALVATILAPAAATLALSGPASADVKGVTLKMTQPETLVAGGPAGTLSVTAATDGTKPGCRKVRWTLVIRVQGVQLDQVQIQRLEGDGDFPVDVQASGDTARITDRRFDTGSLCSDKTDTAAYAIAVTGGQGSIAFRSEPRDAANRLLSSATSQSTVSRAAAVAPPAVATGPSPSPSASPSPSESDAAAIVPAEDPPTATLPAPAVIPAAVKDRSPSLLGPGLVIGGLLVLIGVGLLFRMRRRAKRDPRGTAGFPPTSFYPTYR